MNIIITGASTGIGYATAVRFAKEGNHTIIAIARTSSLLNQLCGECQPGTIIPVNLDIATYNFEKLIQILNERQLHHIDVLIHNAGHLVNKPFEQLEVEDWNAIYNINVIGVAMLTRALLSRMGGERHTHIVMNGSIGGMNGSLKFPGLSAYSSSKGALSILSEVLAEEFKGRNITVNCLALGSVQTEMLKKAFPAYLAKLTAHDISEYIYDFSLTGWRYFNGKILPVSTANP